MKPLLTIGVLDHISSQERANLGLPFSVQLTIRKQQALRMRSKYFRGGANISKYLDRGVRTFRGSKYFVTGQDGVNMNTMLACPVIVQKLGLSFR